DGKIDVKLLVKDGFGNPYRAEGMRTLLAFDGMRIKGDDEDAALANLKNLFLLAGELSFTADINGAAENRQIAVQSVDGFPNLRLPPPLELDPGNGYRLQWLGVPRQVFVGEEYQIGLQVSLGPNPIPLHHKTFVLRSEFAGETSSTSVVMEGQSSFVELSAPARIGTIRLTVSDQDFGDLSAEVQVLPKPVATSFQLRDVQYSESELMFRILGSDQYGNDLSLKQKLAQVKLIADGGEVLLDRSVVIQDQLSFPVARQTDRLRVEVLVDGFSQPQLAEAPLRQQLSVQELAQLPWETPFVVLGGAAFGDLRWGQNAVQSLLFGSLSQVQAVVSEATPHRGPPKVISIFPSGRPLFGPDMKMELTWDNHKPVLVFADADRELGRLLTNPDQLNFSVLRASTGFYQWSKREGRGKALLVLDSGQFEGTGLAQGDLLDSRGRKAISFDQSRLIFHDDRIQTEVIDRGVDSLVLEFSWENEVLAQWYLDFDLTQIAVGELGPLEWRFSGTQSEHLAEDFFAGESTADGVMGLNILKKSNIISYDVGEGKGLDDVYQKNGQGFTDEDKSSLSLLAGDSVGESFQQQSEGIMVFGDPVSSLQSIRHRGDGGAKVSPFDSADTNFSIGQHVYRPEGEITQLLRLDVEGDGEDDLLVLEKRGSDSIVRYLEGKGEGYRWGAVSDLLNLGPDLRDAQVVSGKHLLALYESGQLFLEENQGGRFVRKAIDLSDLGLRNQALIDLAVRDVDDDDQDDLIFITGRRELWVWYGREDSTGYVFGLQDRDQQRLKTFGMPISTAENYKTAMWLYTQITPEVEAGCRRNELVCKPGYFKGYEGGARQDDGREVDRLALLQEQAGDVGFKNVDEDDQRQFLVRLDQSELYRRFIDIDFTSHRAGDQLNLNDQIDFRVSINPRRGEEEFVLRFDLGDAFELVGQPQCQGCGDLSVTQKPGMMWSLGGRLSGGQQVSLTFSARLVQMPNFSLNILKTNGDRYPDLGVNVEGNDGPILLFQSQNRARQFVETFFGDNAGLQRRASPQRSQQDLSDLMRGVGAE
ncbi:MAG: hypothetical protein Q8P95_00005, partial [bacterium]|nr:hypothetical protein [bacterium]